MAPLRPLVFAHIGDLHLTEADAQNARDLRAIVETLDGVEGIDFVYLPGDNAENGRPEQYALVRAALDALRLPVHVVTGDHDMEGGSLEPFYACLGVQRLPYAADVSGVRCLFLDMCGSGSGGPDFRLGADQIAWLRGALAEADADGQDVALFMHSYPADLKGEGEAALVSDLVARSRVRLVEMGHTHYNEIANEGRTIYAAARSTGQIEEGPVGFAVAAIDAGVVSWRFHPLATGWPLVLVTAPADRRLAHDAAQAVGAETEIRALVLGDAPIAECRFSIDGGPWLPMTRPDGERCHRARLALPPEARGIAVRATDARGRTTEDRVEPARDAACIRRSEAPGSDAAAIGAWPERGLLGTQLGPNRNGRQW
ncbi:metallophosphoesterase family protein [Methylobacterium oxalidis]|uniref:Calcineurin-like phosphoesterase domain-containing protein n=1 Tax=Methylobacterium oxalidis TaxID=944322 RepID=A0A512J5V7_9HYPH|nr:metallophosphoesterase [Methylobacterium oxalidis]GEP05364.1 hypothetical protein MOX02_34020 [Methylobacterium oxalidis]GJE31374.1 3',5'-cyclic adenosine monophosphate phosphodiesterase CpdA [Methylobacterium oxalidis]GLS63498.1 hypothetical protein GCM10007888_18790 [Methylobacterium oxalidis]